MILFYSNTADLGDVTEIYYNIYTRCPLNEVGARIGSMEEIKENKNVSYHFAFFAIVNELLIMKNRRINPAYWLMQARCGCYRSC